MKKYKKRAYGVKRDKKTLETIPSEIELSKTRLSYEDERELERLEKYKIGNKIHGRIMKEDLTVGQVHAFNQLKSNIKDSERVAKG